MALDMAQQQVVKLFFFFFFTLAPSGFMYVQLKKLFWPPNIHVVDVMDLFLHPISIEKSGDFAYSFFYLVSFYCLRGSQNVPVDKQGCVFSPPRCSLPSTLAE